MAERHRKAPLKDEKSVALYIAMVVRNAMEDFHVKHLSDAQMKELNPIVRNAVYTALQALSLARKSPMARNYVGFQPDFDSWGILSTERKGGLCRQGLF